MLTLKLINVAWKVSDNVHKYIADLNGLTNLINVLDLHSQYDYIIISSCLQYYVKA